MSVRVLIVDDQAPFRQAARAVTEATDGFAVVGEAETGEASVTASQELKPDLVLMDVNLPGINGLEATRQILKDSNGVVVVLLLSTYEEEEYSSKAAECGASAYIAKSRFDPDRLSAAWATASRDQTEGQSPLPAVS
jgi:DNA-binding NarL/FixJ family response regulator